jgi:hypothetical protein
MAFNALQSLMCILDGVRPALTAPGFANLRVLFAGWVLTAGRRAVTEALVNSGMAGRRHHEAFHRFFSRGAWVPDDLGKLVFLMLGRALGDVPLRFVIDDTLVRKRGAQVFGIGSHIDPVLSTKRFRILAFGHVWVVFAALIRVPFSARFWALPLLFRLYRGKKECARKGQHYKRKTDLAREMLDVVAGWTEQRSLSVAMDSAYCCDTVMRGLPASIVVFGSLRSNAVLTAPAESGKSNRVGRPRVRGRSLPNPRQMVASKRHHWQSCKTELYGKKKTVRFKEVVAQWYRGCGKRLLRIVVTESDDAEMVRVFFCTDTTVLPSALFASYAERWAIEVCFRNLKQILGFGDSSARKKQAVERVAPFVGLTYSILVCWALGGVHSTPLVKPPLRPWYPHKRGLSFADILRAARHALSDPRLLDLRLDAPLKTKTPSLERHQHLVPARRRLDPESLRAR